MSSNVPTSTSVSPQRVDGVDEIKKPQDSLGLPFRKGCQSFLFSPLGVFLGGSCQIANVLPGVAGVNLPNNLGGIAEPVSNIFVRCSVFDGQTSESMPHAVGCEAFAELVSVEADAFACAAEVLAPRSLRPLAPIAVGEHEAAFGLAFEPAKEVEDNGFERDESSLAGLFPVLVFFKTDALCFEVDVIPNDFSHLASSDASSPHKEDGASDRLRAFAHQGKVFGFEGGPARFGDLAFQDFREAVGIAVDHSTFFVVSTPTKAANDRGDGALLGVLGFPVLVVGAQPFGQVELFQALDGRVVADEGREVFEVAFAVGNVVCGEIAGNGSAVEGSFVGSEKSGDGYWFGHWAFLEQS